MSCFNSSLSNQGYRKIVTKVFFFLFYYLFLWIERNVHSKYDCMCVVYIDLRFGGHLSQLDIQSTLVISNSKGLTETLRDIRTSTYQS